MRDAFDILLREILERYLRERFEILIKRHLIEMLERY